MSKILEDKILNIVKNNSNLVLDKKVDNNSIIIIDFYNVYCNIIKFNKYNLFSRDTYILCMNIILKKFKKQQIIIVSKKIFEIEDSYISNLTNINLNLTYIIPEDKPEYKTKNRERDDYTCFLINYIKNLLYKNNNVYILSNDNFRNIDTIVKHIKPYILKMIIKNKEYTYNISNDFINKNHDDIIKNNINRLHFNFN